MTYLSRRQTGFLALATFLSIAGAALGLTPFVAAYNISLGFSSEDASVASVIQWSSVAALAVAVKSLSLGAATTLSHRVAFQVMKHLRIQLAQKLVHAPLGFVLSKSAAEIQKNLVEDVNELEDAVAHAVPELAVAASIPIISALLIAVVDIRLALASVLFIPFLLLAYRASIRQAADLAGPYGQAMSLLQAQAIQFVRGMPVLRTFWHSGKLFEGYAEAVAGAEQTGKAYASATLWPMAFFYAGIQSNLLIVLPLGWYLLSNGSVTVNELGFVLLVAYGMNTPLLRIIFTAGTFFLKLRTTSERLSEVLEWPSLVDGHDSTLPRSHALIFDNVSFYAGDQSILQNVSFKLTVGSTLALVGKSGSGKSTIAKLALRFDDPTTGRIMVGDVDAKTIPIADLNQCFSAVFQDPWLENKTLRENIMLGRKDASQEDVMRAARAAGVLDFAPDLDVNVGEGGQRLSGGERQRVAIARALLKDAPILILDEPTASLDGVNEDAVLSNLFEYAKRKTIILISHRLNTVKTCDQIAFLENGSLSALGTHDTLYEKSTGYRELWTRYEAVEGWRLRPGAPKTMPKHVSLGESAIHEHGLRSSFIGLVRDVIPSDMWQTLQKAFGFLGLQTLLSICPVIIAFAALYPSTVSSIVSLSLVFFAVSLIAILCLQTITNRFAYASLWHVQTGTVASLQRRIASHLSHVPVGYFSSNATGSTAALVTRHAAGIDCVTPATQFTRLIVCTLAVSVILIIIDWRLALLGFSTLSLAILLIMWRDSQNRVFFEKLNEINDKLASNVFSFVEGVPTMRTFNLPEESILKMTAGFERCEQEANMAVKALVPSLAIGWAFLDLAFCAVICLAGVLAVAGQLESHQFFISTILVLALFAPWSDLFDLASRIQSMRRSTFRIANLLNQKMLEEPTCPSIPEDASIEVRNLSFSYGGQLIFHDFSAAFAAGKIHAIVGPSGSGKSTLLALMARFWDPDAGQIIIGGVDMKNIPGPQRSRVLAVVLQDTFLFEMSIEDNIKIGKPDASHEEVVAVAKATLCHDFVSALPDGYQTLVGNETHFLSGGEKQRISIARALLKDAPIVLLDEATASVDPDGEYEIRRSIAELCAGRTVILITHRQETLRSVDQIVELPV